MYMKRHVSLSVVLLVFALSLAMVGAQDEMSMSETPVYEIAIRQIIDPEAFAAASAELETLLAAQEGYLGSLEYTTIVSLAPEIAEGDVYGVGVTAWASAEAYEASAALMEDPAVGAYLETIETVQNVVIEPFVKGEAITLDDFPGPGEVFEVAIRDLASYEDPVDFLRTIRGFTDLLGAEEGVLREYEWVSVDGQYFVGMTRYASVEAFSNASQSEALFSSPVVGQVFAQYPPMVAQIGVRSE
jgi:hypothetical protein